MSEKESDKFFDELLSSAFNEYADGVLSDIPSDKELSEAYPLSREAKKKIEGYVRVRRRNKRKKIFVVFTRVSAAFILCACLLVSAVISNGAVRSSVADSVSKWYDSRCCSVSADFDDFVFDYSPDSN